MRFRNVALLMAATLVPSLPAHAASKEIIELQTQVQQLLDMVQRLQSTVDSRFGVLQHLVEQSTDGVNQMTTAVNSMQQKINAQSEANSGKLDGVSGQVQSLNDSIDELKTRMGKLDKELQDVQSQLQTMQAQSTAAANPAGAQQGQPGTSQQPGIPGQQSQPGAGDNGGGAPQVPQQPQDQAPPLQDTYQSGLRDYNAARYDVAAGEFGDIVHYYPNDPLAGNAQFYLGEISYRQQKYRDAIKAYNQVLENFAGNPKAPAAQLRKGESLLQMGQREQGIHELRSLIQRYPQTPEASQARTKLNAMGVRINPRPGER